MYKAIHMEIKDGNLTIRSKKSVTNILFDELYKCAWCSTEEQNLDHLQEKHTSEDMIIVFRT